MEISTIKNIGKFDNVVINSCLYPIYNTNELNLMDNMSFSEVINYNSKNEQTLLSKLKLSIVGQIGTDNGNKNYLVAYSDLILLKSNELILDKINFKDKKSDVIQRASNSIDEINLCLAGLDIASHSKYFDKDEADNINICGIHKVYVNKYFRKQGISNWFHKNFFDLIFTYTNIKPNILVLSYGDFADEASTEFGMSNKDYCELLHRIYKMAGYKDINIMWKLGGGLNYSAIMYKVVNSDY